MQVRRCVGRVCAIVLREGICSSGTEATVTGKGDPQKHRVGGWTAGPGERNLGNESWLHSFPQVAIVYGGGGS